MRIMRLNSSSLLVIVSLMLFLSAEGAVQAQSGRRMPKGSGTAPPPTAEPQQPAAQSQATPAQPQISVLVLGDIQQSVNLLVPFPDRVLSWVVKRLRDSAALSVMEGERANRSEAIKRAKASKDTFVIYLKVDESGFSPVRPGSGRVSLDNVSVSYSVFTPVTGKAQSSGVIYLGQRSTMGRVRTLPICYPSVRGNDLLLLEASLEAAERIMSALDVSAPPPCR